MIDHYITINFGYLYLAIFLFISYIIFKFVVSYIMGLYLKHRFKSIYTIVIKTIYEYRYIDNKNLSDDDLPTSYKQEIIDRLNKKLPINKKRFRVNLTITDGGYDEWWNAELVNLKLGLYIPILGSKVVTFEDYHIFLDEVKEIYREQTLENLLDE